MVNEAGCGALAFAPRHANNQVFTFYFREKNIGGGGIWNDDEFFLDTGSFNGNVVVFLFLKICFIPGRVPYSDF